MLAMTPRLFDWLIPLRGRMCLLYAGICLVGLSGLISLNDASAKPRTASVSIAAAPATAKVKKSKKHPPAKPAKKSTATNEGRVASKEKPSAQDKNSIKEGHRPNGFLHITAAKNTQDTLHTLLLKGFAALQAGEYHAAQQYYAHVLHYDKEQTDALLGLANIALREERSETARDLYQRVLAHDPFSADALAGMVLLDGARDFPVNESRLKTAITHHSKTPSLYFVLGNLYSRQQRWGDAQEAYFNAYTLAPYNPDYTFNLAVSLEHLRQFAQAMRYYQEALDKSANQVARFNSAEVRQRLTVLSARPGRAQ